MAAVAPPPESLDPPSSTSESASAAASAPAPNPTSDPSNPSPNPNPTATPPVVTPPPPAPPVAASFTASFRPLGAPPPPAPQYGAMPNPSYPMAQGMQPPGPAGVMPPGAPRPVSMYAPPPGMTYGQPPNGFMPQQPGAAIPPPGVPRYPTPYPMIRPGFPPRPMPPVGMMPLQRPGAVPGIRGVPPMVTPVARPALPVVTPAEKPQTTVYVGKIASTVDNDFLLSLLRLCGPVKSWKRAQDPSDGTPKGFGFCEFESAEGILRAMRLLSKLSVDGQELVLNINQATREYLDKYVEKKSEREKTKESETQGGNQTGSAVENEKESSKTVPDETGKEAGDAGEKRNQESTNRHGIVTDEDSEADKVAMEKISSMIDERIKTKPPPPPPVQQSADVSSKTQPDLPSKHKTGEPDAEAKNEDIMTDKRTDTDSEKPEANSPDRRRVREREREKREKERELERYERERERERVRREREREQKVRETERLYKDRLKEWESREREKEYQRQYEKDREKERERERKREILKQEDESDDEDTRKRRRRSTTTLEERRRKRQREKEEDLADRLKEEEEFAEAKRRAAEDQLRKEEAAAAAAAKAAMQKDIESSLPVHMEEDKPSEEQEKGNTEEKPFVADKDNGSIFANGLNAAGGIHRNNSGDELGMGSGTTTDVKQNTNAPAKKLGFGLIGSGKRTSVPSVFVEEDDEDIDEKRMRPLVPIDYSTEELQAVQTNASAAAEFAKRISVSNPKEEKIETEKERNRRSGDRSSQRDRDRNDDDNARVSDERKEKMHDREKDRQDKPKSENKKILDAKQLIDMIPKTKEELFAYDINWAVYDKHELHERMKPWISKKIIEFLGEEEATLVDYIISCTQDHVQASKMLELLQSILDVEAEMFVLKMWRMLIFEIKKVETGLSGTPKA